MKKRQIFATLALVEGLLEKGYLVRLFTLKQMQAGQLPAGAPIHPMYNHYKKKLTEKIKRCLFLWNGHKRYLNMDPAVDAIPPVSGIGMTFWMKHIHAKTVISTRESLHFFLQEATSEMIKNRLYFFHTSSNLIETLFPGVIEKLNSLGLNKVLFVTEKNRLQLKKICGFNNYESYCVLGNAVSSARSIDYNEIVSIEKTERKTGIYLLRINHERARDIQHLVAFGEYVKRNNIEDIKIDVYGDGDYVEQFTNQLLDSELDDIIGYCGAITDIKSAIARYDFAIDFSENQSFGMVYIESILNGKMIFCRHNEGSDEVLKDIPQCFFKSNEELIEKIRQLDDVSQEMLRNNYTVISRVYSRKAIATKFVAFMED